MPELRDFPAKYIFEPWTAPLDVQRKAGCIVGEHYPAPIVDHAVVSKANMAKMKAAYDAAKQGGGGGGGAGSGVGSGKKGAGSGSSAPRAKKQKT